jgi:predicted Rossmann fold nucleotide-binding protein DprA/Smf involved in DNA uptake
MISENTKAVLLLTTYFNSKEVKQYKPLTENGYGYLACWLSQNGYKPEDLLKVERFDSMFDLWDNQLSHTKPKKTVGFAKLDKTIADITYERLYGLINRGASLSIALDKWQSAGIWILDRQHPQYPKAIKAHLKHKSPALFFGIGNPALLNKPAIGFVGSRDCTPQDTQATHEYVQAINQMGYQVVSGAAKGVDSEAMLASINSGYSAIGIMAESIFRASASGQWRQALRENRLVLISPFYPEASFSPENAMARNKYIYMLSAATLVICSSETGGTWEGANENLQRGWVPMFVSTHAEPLQTGNQALLNGGNSKTKLLSATAVSVADVANCINEATHANVLHNESTDKREPIAEPEGQLSMLLTNDDTPQGDMFGNHDDDSLEFYSPETVVQPQSKTPILSSEEPEVYRTKLSRDITGNTGDEKIPEMPLLTSFYHQLVSLIHVSDKLLVTEDQIKSLFPEFDLIGKSALASWLKHLVEIKLLVRPNARKKEYTLPDAE